MTREDRKSKKPARDLRLPGSVAEIMASPPGPKIGAFFDLDGTLVAGFTAVILTQERLRRRELRADDLPRLPQQRHVDEARGLLDARFRAAADMRFLSRIGIAPARSQVRADDNHPPGLLPRCRPRTIGSPVRISGFQSAHSQAGASSPPSNNWIGAPGMMVEIACL